MKIINLISLLVCFILTGCDPSDSRLKFVNNSSSTVFVEISNDSSNFKFNDISYYKRSRVLKDSNFIFSKMGSHHAMTDYIEKSQHKRLFLVIFSLDSLNKYQNPLDLNSLFKEKKYLALKCYTRQNLVDNDWTISY
jgi:hypothetical protein